MDGMNRRRACGEWSWMEGVSMATNAMLVATLFLGALLVAV